MNSKGVKIAVILFAIFLFLVAAFFIVFSSLKNDKIVNPSNSSQQNLTKVYCDSESRNAQVCSQVYAPVCGYPILKTFSNSCFACMDASVNYYINGECS